MKQRITVEQLQELTDEQKKRLRDWWKPQDYDLFIRPNGLLGIVDIKSVNSWNNPDENDLPLLSMGQMIQMINDQQHIKFGKLEDIAYDNLHFKGIGNSFFIDIIDTTEMRKVQYREFGEIVDVLWKVIKQI